MKATLLSVTSAVTNNTKDIKNLTAAVGSPLVAKTTNEMKDKNKIYVYTGAESGYTKGNWYYYNGTAWTSGGVYNSVAVQTDKTLSVSDVPADAEATGSKVSTGYTFSKEYTDTTAKHYVLDIPFPLYKGERYTINIQLTKGASGAQVDVLDTNDNGTTWQHVGYVSLNSEQEIEVQHDINNIKFYLMDKTNDDPVSITYTFKLVSLVTRLCDAEDGVSTARKAERALIGDVYEKEITTKSSQVYISDIKPFYAGTQFKIKVDKISGTSNTVMVYLNSEKNLVGGLSYGSERTFKASVDTNRLYLYLTGREDEVEIKVTLTIIGVIDEIADNLVYTKSPIEDMMPTQYYVTDSQKEDAFHLLWFSDIHADKTRLQNVVKYMDEHKGILADAVCTGDMVSNIFSDDFAWWSDAGAQNIIMTIGNHDMWLPGETPEFATEANVYSKFIEPYISQWNITQYETGKTYFYKDYENQKITLIALNPTLIRTGDTESINAQNSFFVDALEHARTKGFTVIACTHYPMLGISWGKGPFQTIRKSDNWQRLDLSEWTNAIKNFKANGGLFACWLAGHEHSDLFGVYDNSQLVFVVTTANMYSAVQSNIPVRNAGTYNENAFDIVSIDTTNHVVSLKRVGACYDIWGRKLDSLCFDYDTLERLDY